MTDAERIRFGAYVTSCMREEDLTLKEFSAAVGKFGATLGWTAAETKAEMIKVVKEISEAQAG